MLVQLLPQVRNVINNSIVNNIFTLVGDGDILMRFLPSFLAVELMRQGHSPQEAGKIALERIIKHYSEFMGAIVVADKFGNYDAACHGIDYFPFSIYNLDSNDVQVIKKSCE